ncbi:MULTISPECIES: hypothetical protein [unclassified Saccharopolyspora]|uniref:hypothetical protein n=1 Tax=unclassified Saccharopolyspora TaxID=2646250 RepID=UPI001CD4F152|nr:MULTISPECIES: hypothetical protein [unclassified Saccharopolyspora]MCA1188122.1 hypothetical protein [Saccharopolyspora sp. 6T]MCA1193412.1 hypothetical protein [Saccharopolyspora sp. 6V]MCA1226896.1 hypothetical protein [Saccharopolyspora sp. 6M]MCA1280645.1 hypothetical protein [Saccharopolyspora sp. 7B]
MPAFHDCHSEPGTAPLPEVIDAVPLPPPPEEPAVLNVRYRAGIVGERARVVHAATWTPRDVLITLCGMPLDPSLVEESTGMPCMRCIRIAARRAREDDEQRGLEG